MMKKYIKIVAIVLFLPLYSMAGFSVSISPISLEIQERMIKGNSWRVGCPVGLEDLRYLRLRYRDFEDISRKGELIVHKDVAKEVLEIFESLYALRYPIHAMKLVSVYHGNDWHSIEADNTSAFNCRHATGSKKWSKHSYGRAIDINPIENPYISHKGHISHKASLMYKKRVHKKRTSADKAVLLKEDKIVKIFKSHAWKWGGDWSSIKDYQHFSK